MSGRDGGGRIKEAGLSDPKLTQTDPILINQNPILIYYLLLLFTYRTSELQLRINNVYYPLRRLKKKPAQ